jgi:hypothetical protein
MQGFGYRILPNIDPSINQSFIVIPEGPGGIGGIGGIGYPNYGYPSSNYMMSNESRKNHKHKHKHRHRHRHYEGQYGQFGMPILSPEFLSPEFPVPIPGYPYGYTDPANEALTQITKAANDTSAVNPGGTPTAVIAAVNAILTTLNNPRAAAVVSAVRTSINTIGTAPLRASDVAARIIAAASTAVTTSASISVPGLPVPGLPYPVLSPRFNNVRHITDPDADPELRRKVVKHFYKELKKKYFIDKFNTFFQYIIIENDKSRLVKTYEEYKKNENDHNNSKIKIKFITENIFSKYDLEVLISKLIAKYGMLNSDDENNMHWYNSKNKYASLIKKAMYKKIKYRLEKKVNF